jgi:hypothetical protein
MRTTLFAISLLLACPSKAQDLYSTGSCEPAQADTYLEVGNVRARLFNNGALFWKGSPNVYEVPAGGGVQSAFAASFLVAGKINGEVRTAANRYGPHEFWPGPIPIDGSAPASCSDYDRFWLLDYVDDVRFDPSRQSPSHQKTAWPTQLGAPFIDHNGTDGYQPHEGDYPEMYGDQQVYWIMNDRGNEHTQFNSKLLGIEVQVHAFGFDTSGDVANTTFYRYRVENKGTSTIKDMAVGMFADVDLGFAGDDYVGTDTSSSMLYFYNADNEDDSGYGTGPPAIGISILEAFHSEGTLPSNLKAPAGDFATSTFAALGAGVQGDPRSAEDIYNFMNGRWRDGHVLTNGGSGLGFSNDPISFYMPGDPVSGSFWSEVNADGNGFVTGPADRHGFISHGPFDLAPGEWVRFTFAYVWARGANNMDSVVELRDAARFIHEQKHVILAPRNSNIDIFDDNPAAPGAGFPFWVDEPYPNPADDQLSFRASFDKSGPVSIRVIDSLGRTRLQQTHNAQSAGEQTLELDTSSLTPGAYTVTIESWSHRASHSFVVLR